jgi:hypothetical protein
MIEVTKIVSDGARAVADVREIGRRLASGEWWMVPICSPQGITLWEDINATAKGHRELTYLQNPAGPVVAIGMIGKRDFPAEAFARYGSNINPDDVLITPADAPAEVVRWILHQLGVETY